jgi:hypothetical protein
MQVVDIFSHLLEPYIQWCEYKMEPTTEEKENQNKISTLSIDTSDPRHLHPHKSTLKTSKVELG